MSPQWEYEAARPGGDGRVYLPTIPDTQVRFEATRRTRPCWRCLTYRRWLGRRHWNCTFGPVLGRAQ